MTWRKILVNSIAKKALQRKCWLLVSILTFIGNLAEAVLLWGSSALGYKPGLHCKDSADCCYPCQPLSAIRRRQSCTGKFSLAIQAWTWSAQVALEVPVLLGHGLGGHEQECHWLGLQYGWSTILRPSSLQRQWWLLVSILTLIGNLAEAVLHWGSSAMWYKSDLEVLWLHFIFWLS